MAGIIGKASSDPNLNLFNNCLLASSLPDSRCSRSSPVGRKSKKSQSPKVPIFSISETMKPVPIPPPTAMPTNFSKPAALFKSFTFFTVLAALTLLVVFAYRPVLIALTKFFECLATLLITGALSFMAILLPP